MAGTNRLADYREAREKFDAAVQGMERFILNLDPRQGQLLRDWLRTVAVDGRADQASGPPMKEWPLAEQIGAHMEAVLKTRMALQHAWRLLEPSEQAGLPPPADLVSGRKSRRKAD